MLLEVRRYSTHPLKCLHGTLDVPVIVFYLKIGQVGEFAFKSGSVRKFNTYRVETGFKAKSNSTTRYTYTQADGATFIQFPYSPVIHLLDLDTAYSFFAPPTVSNPNVAHNE